MAQNSPRLPRKGAEGPPYGAHGTGGLLLDRLPCYMCTDVLSDQVTTPCGHSFCKTCLTDCWKSQRCVCPLCKKEFSTRPELQMNGTPKAVADHYRQNVQPGRPDVLCGVCPGVSMKALKSCLDCELNLCDYHLEPHDENKKLQEHKLIDPVENLEEYICQKHQKPLEMLCKDEQMFICQFCTKGVHKNHLVIPLEVESDDKRASLVETQTEVRQLIRQKLKEIYGLIRSQELSTKITEKDKAESVDVFTALIGCIEKSQAELLKTMEKKKTAERRDEENTKELKQEIFELKRMDFKIDQLLHTDDHLKLMKGYPSVGKSPPVKTKRPDVKINPDVNTALLRAALSQLQKTLKEKFIEIELKMIQQYAVNVTLDPETAHPHLILSRDGKEVRHGHGDPKQNVPQSPKRFTFYPIVLGHQGFSSGRFYYKVQVGKKTDWELGVAGESVNRKKKNTTLKPQNGFWTVILQNGNDYTACAEVSDQLALKARPEKVGVFVDYEEGLVSFYDVENKSHIYSYTGQSFTEKLYPYFSPSENPKGQINDPLIICPV